MCKAVGCPELVTVVRYWNTMVDRYQHGPNPEHTILIPDEVYRDEPFKALHWLIYIHQRELYGKELQEEGDSREGVYELRRNISDES